MSGVISKGCEYCGGDLLDDDEGGLKCLQCSRPSTRTRESFAPAPKKIGRPANKEVKTREKARERNERTLDWYKGYHRAVQDILKGAKE